MLYNITNDFLNQNNYHFSADTPVFEELESMHFVGLIAHLAEHGISVDLGQFYLELDASYQEFIDWLSQFNRA